jgi:hypothetical protein
LSAGRDVTLTGLLGPASDWIAYQCVQPRYVATRLEGFREELTKMRRPVL